MKELEEKEKLLDYRNAYKKVNVKNQNKDKDKIVYTSNNLMSPNKETLKTIPEGDNENYSKKYTEDDDRKNQSNISKNSIPVNISKNYIGSPQGNQLYSSQNMNNTSHSRQEQGTDLVYSSDNDEDKRFEEIKKKYSHIKRESNLSDYESHNIHNNNSNNNNDLNDNNNINNNSNNFHNTNKTNNTNNTNNTNPLYNSKAYSDKNNSSGKIKESEGEGDCKSNSDEEDNRLSDNKDNRINKVRIYI